MIRWLVLSGGTARRVCRRHLLRRRRWSPQHARKMWRVASHSHLQFHGHRRQHSFFYFLHNTRSLQTQTRARVPVSCTPRHGMNIKGNDAFARCVKRHILMFYLKTSEHTVSTPHAADVSALSSSSSTTTTTHVPAARGNIAV